MNFDYDNPEYDDEMGHFYQLVYPYTEYVGVGVAYDETKKDGKAYIVARYLAGSSSSNIKETPKPVNSK